MRIAVKNILLRSKPFQTYQNRVLLKVEFRYRASSQALIIIRLRYVLIQSGTTLFPSLEANYNQDQEPVRLPTVIIMSELKDWKRR